MHIKELHKNFIDSIPLLVHTMSAPIPRHLRTQSKNLGEIQRTGSKEYIGC